MMTLTPSQQTVFRQIIDFAQSDANVFILRGYAGTGKTTMIKAVADELSKHSLIALMAPTGRAARVLASKTGHRACTIHRSIYSHAVLIDKSSEDIAETDIKYRFPIVENQQQIIAIVDEASMLCSRTIQQEIFQFGTDNLMDDLLTYVRPSFGGKIIFVGDPAQLPPVGESVSNALKRDFFVKKGFKVMETELTEILRQSGDSAILKNAMRIRELLSSDVRNNLVFEEKDSEVELIQYGQLLDRYISDNKTTQSKDSVVICFSNQRAYEYNKVIREALYGLPDPPLKVGDVLMVVQNNYALDKMNGEFVRVLDVGETIRQSAPVFVQNGGTKERRVLDLDFIRIKIDNGFGVPTSVLLLLDLLNNGKASVSIDQQRALYINFKIRHKNLRPGTIGFCEALQTDEFYNCLRAKYGYAVTGHKCQGGEWDKAYVDYNGRTGLSDDCLRWAYTATTRARNTLYVTNFVQVTAFSNFRIDDVQLCKKINPEFRRFGHVELSPFHTPDTLLFLHAKWMCIESNLQNTGFKTIGVDSRPYLEMYSISTPDGIVRVDMQYRQGGIFLPARCAISNPHAEHLLQLINDESQMPIAFDYHPSDEIHEQLYHLISNACDTLDIQITNIVEHPEDYSVIFYFRTSDSVSYFKIYVNNKGFVSYAKPMSLRGKEDVELQMLIEEIKKHFK